MVVRMRHTRSQRGNVRSHHALKGARFSKCPDCGAQRLSHTACTVCGKYNGRQVVDIAGLAAKKDAKMKKRAAQGAPSADAK